MSILNAALLDDRHAVVTVDTLSSAGAEGAKMLPAPHLGAVLAHRGRQYAARVAECMLISAHATFDAAADGLVEALDYGLAEAAAYDRLNNVDAAAYSQAAFGDPDALASLELVLVGFSARFGSMRCFRVKRFASGALEHGDLAFAVGPAIAVDAKTLLATDAGALTLAQAQMAGAKGRPGYGGRLLVARLAATPRVEIVLRDLGPLTVGVPRRVANEELDARAAA